MGGRTNETIGLGRKHEGILRGREALVGDS